MNNIKYHNCIRYDIFYVYHLLNLNLQIFFWISLFPCRYSRYLIIEFSYLQEALYLVNNSVSYLQSCLIFWEQRGTTYSILLIFKGSKCFIFLNDNDEQSAHTQINAAPVSCRQSFCFPSWHWRWQPGPAPLKDLYKRGRPVVCGTIRRLVIEICRHFVLHYGVTAKCTKL